MKNVLKKQVSFAFHKKIYLLGQDNKGIKYWLEEPSWEYDWYWEFGYIQTYTNNRSPYLSKDVTFNSHFSSFVGEQEEYDYDKGYLIKGKYIHNVYDSPKLAKTVFNETEGWKLTELFKQFYLSNETADFCHQGSTGTDTIKEITRNKSIKDCWKLINFQIIPAITKEILKTLTPKKEKKNENIQNYGRKTKISN